SDGILFRAAPTNQPSLGRSVAKYQVSAKPTPAGKNASVENFESMARPVLAPNSAARPRVGRSTQIRPVRNAAPRKAVSAISVVASPAWASTGGRKLNRKTATTATDPLKYRRPHQYTT